MNMASTGPRHFSTLLIGIPNLSDNSHVSTALQVLLHNDQLSNMLQKSYEACLDKECLLCSVFQCMNGLYDGDLTSLQILSEITLKNYALRDPFDLFVLLLGKLHHAFVSLNADEISPVSKLLAGSFTRSGCCLQCQGSSRDTVELFSFNICVTSNTSAEDAVQKYLSSMNCAGYCDFCRTPNVMVKECSNVTLPRLLCIRFVRSPQDSSLLRKCITVNQEICLNQTVKYKLTSCVLADKDHFSFIKKMPKTGIFYAINDTSITKVLLGNLASREIGQRVHMIIYEQVDQLPETLPQLAVKSHTPDMHALEKNKVISTSENWNVTLHDEHDNVTPLKDTVSENPNLSDSASDASSTELERRKMKKLIATHDFQLLDSDSDDTSGIQAAKTDNEGLKMNKRKRKISAQVEQFQSTIQKKKKNKNMWRTEFYANGVKNIYVRVMISYELWEQNMDENDFKFFTGLSKCNFQAVYQLLGGESGIMKLKLSHDKTTPHKKIRPLLLSAKSRLLLCLVRMRRGTPLRDLAYQFGIGKSYAGNIFFGVLRNLRNTFQSMEAEMFSPSENQKKNIPEAFKPFPDVKVILDGAEFRIEAASNYQQQGNTWSQYKHSNTAKYLIGISVFGAVIFVSEGFEGRMSDNEILKESGVMSYLKPGDAVMCDRGFKIVGELLEAGIKTIEPPSFGKRKCFTPEEQRYNSAICQSRIYVEHAIGKIKEFRILRYTIPLSLRGTLNDLVYVAGYLTAILQIAPLGRRSSKNQTCFICTCGATSCPFYLYLWSNLCIHFICD